MRIEVHIWDHRHSESKIDKILELLLDNKIKINQIMPTLQELQAQVTEFSAQVDDLQATVDAVQGKIGTAIADFEKQIADLQAIIAAGGSDPVALQAIADGLTTAKEKLASAKADLEATPTV